MEYCFEIHIEEEELYIYKKLFITKIRCEKDSVVISNEHDDFKWVPFNEVKSNLFGKATLKPLQRLGKYYKNNHKSSEANNQLYKRSKKSLSSSYGFLMFQRAVLFLFISFKIALVQRCQNSSIASLPSSVQL